MAYHRAETKLRHRLKTETEYTIPKSTKTDPVVRFSRLVCMNPSGLALTLLVLRIARAHHIQAAFTTHEIALVAHFAY